MKILLLTTTFDVVCHLSSLSFVDQVFVLTYDDPSKYHNIEKLSKVSLFGSKNKAEFKSLLLSFPGSYRVISCFCPYIFSTSDISHFRYPILNLHTGLIPDNRGRSPLFWDILEGKTNSIGTLHTISPEIDKGFIFRTCSIGISERDNPATLGSRILSQVISNNYYEQWLNLSLDQINNLPFVVDDGIYKKGFYENHSYDSSLFSPSYLLSLWRCHSIWGYIIINGLKIIAMSQFPVKGYTSLSCSHNESIFVLVE